MFDLVCGPPVVRRRRTDGREQGNAAAYLRRVRVSHYPLYCEPGGGRRGAVDCREEDVIGSARVGHLIEGHCELLDVQPREEYLVLELPVVRGANGGVVHHHR